MTLTVDLDQFDSVEDIDAYYRKKINRAEDDEEAALKQEQAEARLAFRERLAERRELKAAKTEALAKYPRAIEIVDEADITGRTPEEIEATAKRFHEKAEALATAAAEKVREEMAPAAARAQYGAGASGSGAGQGKPAASGADPNEEIKTKVRRTLEKGDAISRADSQRFASIRMAEAVEQARDPNSRSYSAVDYKRDAKPSVDARTRRREAANA